MVVPPIRRLVASAMLVTLGLGGLSAQQRGARDVVRWLLDNRRQLDDYTWKMRTEILIDGESMGVRIDRVRYGEDGRLERTPLQSARAEGRGARKKLARAEEHERTLQRLIDSYRQMNEDDMRSAFSRAFVDEAPGGRSGEIRVQVRDVVHRGDSMNLWLNEDRVPTRLEVFTAPDGEPVRMRAEYGKLDDGPSYLATSVVETETGEKKLVIRSESFDFARR